jgi:hypothetical protein
MFRALAGKEYYSFGRFPLSALLQPLTNKKQNTQPSPTKKKHIVKHPASPI